MFPGDQLDRVELEIDGVPIMQLYSADLDLRCGLGEELADLHLERHRQGAFVAVLDSHAWLAHPIRDRSAIHAVSVLAAEAVRMTGGQGWGSEHGPDVLYWHNRVMSLVPVVRRDGRTELDPRDANLVARIAALPPEALSLEALSLEEEADAGELTAQIELAAWFWARGPVRAPTAGTSAPERHEPAALEIAWALVFRWDRAAEDGRPYHEVGRRGHTPRRLSGCAAAPRAATRWPGCPAPR